MQQTSKSNFATSVRRRLRPFRKLIDTRLCRYRIGNLPRNQSLKEVVDFGLRERAIGAQQIRTEIMELASLVAAARPETIVEIGTSRGGTLFMLCRLAPASATIVSVDMPGAGFGEAYTNDHVQLFKLFPRAGQTLHILSADSHSVETVAKVREALGGRPIDLLFIDGDHSYEGVRKDFEMYAPLVRPEGLIAFHDIADSTKFPDCVVKRYWDDIKSDYRHREIIEDSKQGWAGIGVLWKDSSESKTVASKA
ncbi:MAG: class I SAM-dependent methyltransferase [Bryobacteraceae bacterium]